MAKNHLAGGVPKDVLLQRENAAWSMRQRGYTHQRIADELQLDRSTVTKLLQRVSKRINAQLEDLVIEIKVSQVAQLSHIADEAMQAWQRSKDATKMVSKRTSNRNVGRWGQQKPQEDMVTQLVDQDGNPKYLEVARGAMLDIRKLLGLESPARNGEGGAEGAPVPSIQVFNHTNVVTAIATRSGSDYRPPGANQIGGDGEAMG